METEQERLQKLYGEMGDKQLLDMAENTNDLTDAARLALAQELRGRGITPELPSEEPVETTVEPERESGFGPGIPGIFPASASMMEQALEPAQASKDGLSCLISFYDGIELSKACAILEEAEIEPVIEPIAGDAQTGVPPRFEIWLEQNDVDYAKSLLRAKMGLFPLAEVDDEEFEEVGGELVVAQFESASEAQQVKGMLADAGIAAKVEADQTDSATSVVTVAARDQERALAIVAAGMGLG